VHGVLRSPIVTHRHPNSLRPLPTMEFRIHDILVWIRIRIRRSMPLPNRSGLQQKTNLKKIFRLLLFEGTFRSVFKDKKSKRSFSYYFCLMIKGSGSGSGSMPLTNGSGSGKQNKWIRWIRIRIRIRMRSTDSNFYQHLLTLFGHTEEYLFSYRSLSFSTPAIQCRN
jgi:hypothetical protein